MIGFCFLNKTVIILYYKRLSEILPLQINCGERKGRNPDTIGMQRARRFLFNQL